MLRPTPITRAIALIGIPSDRSNRRISAQSSTDITPSASTEGVHFHPTLRDQFSRVRKIRRSRNELQRYQPERSRSTMRLTASTSGPEVPVGDPESFAPLEQPLCAFRRRAYEDGG